LRSSSLSAAAAATARAGGAFAPPLLLVPAWHAAARRAFASASASGGKPPPSGDASSSAEAMSTSADEPEAAAADAAARAAAASGAREEVEKLKASVAELNAARLRLLAEMENVRRIARADVDAAKAYALQSFAKRLLDVADNLGRAVAAVPESARARPAAGGGDATFYTLFEGVAATEKELLKALASVGIEAFGAVGDKFDPHRHEAMLQVPADASRPAGTVTTLLKGGFKLKDRVLRAAQVAVAVAPPA